MKTCVEFESDLFKPFLSDEAQVNPGCYGAELAWWLCENLALVGVDTSYPDFEDWGWFIEYGHDENEYWLCCGNVDGSPGHWRIFLDPKARGLFGRNKAPAAGAQPLLEALDKLLGGNVDIRNVAWSEDYA